MSLATLEHESSDEQVALQQPAKLRGQSSLGESVMIMLVLSIAQRAIGFLRGVLVCIWLNATIVGEWDLANSFFSYAAPLVMLGIPGTFGRYLEYFRTRGALRTVIRRATIACTLLMGGAWIMLITNASY